MWHILLTEPNRERTAERQLDRIGCEPYLPTFTSSSCYHLRSVFGRGRRWRIVERALFPGYLFIPAAHLELFSHCRELAIGIRQRSCPFLRSGTEPATIETKKVTEIMALEKELRTKRARRMKFRVGDQVRLTYGPLSGVAATIHMLTDQERVTLLLDFLGRKSTVLVAADNVEAAAA